MTFSMFHLYNSVFRPKKNVFLVEKRPIRRRATPSRLSGKCLKKFPFLYFPPSGRGFWKMDLEGGTGMARGRERKFS